MTPPSVALERFGIALLLGAVLGTVYGFLRPLRPRHTGLSDLLFLPALFYAWLQLNFAVCKGDIRLGYCCGLLLGGILWEQTLGKALRPVFSGFWRIFGRLAGFLTVPAKNFLKKIRQSVIFLLARAKKTGTIKNSLSNIIQTRF